MIIDRKKINKNDWKNFLKWTNQEKFNFGNPNFYTSLLSINSEKLEKYLIDFYLYNKVVLEDRYDIEWPNWLLHIEGKTFFEVLEKIFKYWFLELNIYFQKLLIFLKHMQLYKSKGIKNFDIEYKLAEEYWEFQKDLRINKVKNYNEWLLFINKHTHIELKGFM